VIGFFNWLVTLWFLKSVNQERYKFVTNSSFLDYEFESDGPRGVIKKVVRFTPQNVNGLTYFNLAFGDWNENEKKIDDHSTSANSDSMKVLATVASTVVTFASAYPDMPIYAQGSTRFVKGREMGEIPEGY
jgi:hypothetical protein